MKKRLQSTGFCLVTLVTLAGAPHAHAADRIITSDTTVSARLQLNAGAAESYLVNDGVTLTFTGTGPAAGGAFNLAAGASLTLGPNPAAAAGAGRIVFLNNSSTSNGGAIYNSGTLSITNASFINTSATSGASVAGGAIFNNAANALLTLDNVDFIGCHAAHTGALRNNGAGVVTGTNLRFDGNYNTTDSTGGNGGAFGQANAGGSTVLDRAVFSGNRSRVLGGAISLSNGAITLNNPVFTDNWTGQYGGAIHIGNRPLAINITAGGTVTDYLYSGNRAGGLAAAAPLEDILSGTASFAPSAAAGGFLYNTGGANTFNIGAGASLTIGLADAADRAADSIASSSAGAQLIKTGAGLLVLNADNSGYIGSTTVAAGRLLLGNAAAKLGGKITVLSGATFGGAGVMEGRNQTGVLQTTTSIDLRAGSVLQAGADPAAAQTLAVGGTLIIAAGATLDFDLFGGTGSDRLTAATLNVQGTGTLRLGAVASGTYTPASWGAGTAFNAVNWAAGITADGVQAGRNLATALTVQSGTALRLVATLDNLALAWTGAAGALWDAAQENWSGADGVTKFLKGDTVTFDSTAANRLITVAAAGVTAREMTVAGAEDHTFGGGAITVTGTLFKTGAGTLTLAGSGTNGFARVSLGGGRLALSAPAQIGGRLGLLTFADSSTARAVFTDDATFSSGAAYDRQIINGAGINGGLLVADGKTLTFQNAVSSGGSGASVFVSNGNYFEILPHGADGTGRVVFRRNTTAAGGGGAVFVNSATFRADNALFEGNWAALASADRAGGALSNAAAALTVLNNAVFTSNSANYRGGALYNAGTLALRLTLPGVTTYENNAAFDRAMIAVNAAGGGFLYSAAVGVTGIDIAAGSTLVIGGADAAKDTLAGAAGAQLNKTGPGALVLRADSSAWAGATAVAGGTLLLRGADAKLGGAVTVRPGAAAGGDGAFTGLLSLETGATLDIGEAGAAAAQTLAVGGTLKAVGATLNFSLFSGGASDRLNVAALDAASAGNTINLAQFISGTYLLGDGLAALAGSALTLRGDGISDGSRQSGELNVVDATRLQLTLTADASRALTWTGAASGTWAGSGSNWSGAALPSGLFADGDAVRFDDTAPAAAPRAIGITAAGVVVAEMLVDTTGTRTFTGGAIVADGAAANGAVLATGTTGRLVKNGAGALVFQNTANTFAGGIALNAGALAFTDGAQLGAGPGAALVFAGGTLRPLASATLSTALEIAAGASAVLDTAAGVTLACDGASSRADAAAMLVKTGAGALLLSGAAALGHDLTRIEAGHVLLRGIAPGDIPALAHTFDLAGGWLDLSDTAGPADGSTANDWAGLVFTGSLGGVIGANDKLTLGAGDTAFGIGAENDGAKRGVFVVVDAGAGGAATLTGANFYAGSTRVRSGVLALSADAQLGDAAASREVILEGGALRIEPAAAPPGGPAAPPLFATARALEIRAASGALAVATGTAEWAGAITGGTLVKTGPGELLLTGATNTHAATEIAGGVLALGSPGALGAGGVRATGAGATLRAAADALEIANAIEPGAAGLAIAPAGRAIAFTGVISGPGALAVTGPGAVTLSGANTLTRLAVGGGARLVAANMRALGGPGAAVTVAGGARLEIAAVNTLAQSLAVDHGALVFANVAAMPENAAMLRISAGGTFAMTGGSTLALTGAPLVTGRNYRLVHPLDAAVAFSIGADTVLDPGAQNAGIVITAPRIDPATGDLVVSGVNQAAAPGRDVAALFDALGAAAGALAARLGESFFFDAADRADGAPTRHLWLRGFGSLGDYDDAGGAAPAHRDRTYGALAGMEHIFADKLLFGFYGGQARTTVKTGNHAETEATQPLGGVYAALRPGVFQATADFMVGVVSADTTRPEGDGVARGSYKTGAASGGVTLGVKLGLWEGGFAQPAVGARHTRLNYKSQRENAADPGAVSIDDFTAERWQALAGVRVLQRFASPWQRPGMASLLLGRRFALDKRNITARGTLLENGAEFSDVCAPSGADGFTAGLGLMLALGGRAGFALRYECEFGDTHTRHDAGATLSLVW